MQAVLHNRAPAGRDEEGLAAAEIITSNEGDAMCDHYAGPVRLAAAILAVPLACIIVGLGIYYSAVLSAPQERLDRKVDKETCGCSCWDGLYKGPHHLHTTYATDDNRIMRTNYKSLYFNMDWQMLAILMAYSIAFYVISHIVKCMARVVLLDLVLAAASALQGARLHGPLGDSWKGLPGNSRLSSSAASSRMWRTNVMPFLLLIFSIYSILYGFWCIINYINDRFYPMLNSQLFFVVTECLSTAFLVSTLDKVAIKQCTDTNALLCICGICISLLHLVLALGESILGGLFGTTSLPSFINARDVLLLCSDIGCVAWGLWLLILRHGSLAGAWAAERQQAKPVLAATAVLWLLYKAVCAF